MRGHRGGGLPPVEVVPIVRPLLLLALDAGAGEDGLTGEKTARLLTCLGVLAEPLGQDVHGPGHRLLGGGDPFGLVDEGPSRRRGVERLGLGQEQVRQGAQPLFGGDGGPRPALGTPGQVDVLQGRQGTGLQNGVPELIGQELPFGQGLKDGGPAFFELGHPAAPVSYRGDDGLVQRAGGLLAVAGDEGNGASLLEEGQYGPHLRARQLQLLRDLFRDVDGGAQCLRCHPNHLLPYGSFYCTEDGAAARSAPGIIIRASGIAKRFPSRYFRLTDPFRLGYK